MRERRGKDRRKWGRGRIGGDRFWEWSRRDGDGNWKKGRGRMGVEMGKRNRD